MSISIFFFFPFWQNYIVKFFFYVVIFFERFSFFFKSGSTFLTLYNLPTWYPLESEWVKLDTPFLPPNRRDTHTRNTSGRLNRWRATSSLGLTAFHSELKKKMEPRKSIFFEGGGGFFWLHLPNCAEVCFFFLIPLKTGALTRNRSHLPLFWCRRVVQATDAFQMKHTHT